MTSVSRVGGGSSSWPSLAVAIPTFMREDVLIATIRQVLMQEPHADEILVVDQSVEHEAATHDALADWERIGKIRWIRHSPANLPSARNRAVKETVCDVILFIDDDVRMQNNLVGSHLRNYSDSSIAAVAGRVLDPNSVTPEEVRPSWPKIMDCRCLAMDSTVRLEDIAAVKGGNHSARIDWIKRIGGYDENYVGWAFREDSDLAIRLWKAGGRVVYDPEASLVHLGVSTGGCRRKDSQRKLPEWQQSFPASYFAVRHLFPTRWFWRDALILNVRKFIFRKDNAYHPWRLPWAVGAYVYGLIKAVKLSYAFAGNHLRLQGTKSGGERADET